MPQTHRRWVTTVLGLVTLLVASCAGVTTPPSETPPAALIFPEEHYQQAIQRGETVFRIEPERSVVTIAVYRSGALARLGHDHVIAGGIHGYLRLADTINDSEADLYVPFHSLVVDEPERRAQAGLPPLAADADIAGTHRNMEKTVDAAHYPFALMHIGGLEREASGWIVRTTLTLRDVTRALRVPIALNIEKNTLGATGQFSLKQTDFGLTPFSVLGGALQVQDQIDLRFTIHASRVPAAQ